MAVPRPVLLAILGLALCVTALFAVRGMNTDDEAVAPAPIPTAPAQKKPAEPAAPGARGRARTRPRADQSNPSTTPAEPGQKAEQAGEAAAQARPARKLSKAEVAKLRDKAELISVAKALGQNDVVVLLFSRPGAADDTAARGAVEQFRSMDGVQLFTPSFENLDDYRPILAGVGVAQVPAIVIAKPGRKAQLVEGYVDSKSLRQQVEDARR